MKTGKIFLLDDDELVVTMLSRALKKDGYEIKTELETDGVVNKIRSWSPDVVMLDINMPEQSGIDILQELRRKEIDSQVVMLTADDTAETAVKAMKLGAADYLTKPIHPEKLSAVLNRFRLDGSPGSVLIIEDDEPSRQLLRRLLSKDGWKIDEAPNAIEGLEKVAQSIPSLILLDLMMPGMDGFEFVNRLRAEEPYRAIPIIVLTAMTLSEEERRTLGEKVTRIAYKASTSWTSLMSELTGIVNRQPPAGPPVEQKYEARL